VGICGLGTFTGFVPFNTRFDQSPVIRLRRRETPIARNMRISVEMTVVPRRGHLGQMRAHILICFMVSIQALGAATKPPTSCEVSDIMTGDNEIQARFSIAEPWRSDQQSIYASEFMTMGKTNDDAFKISVDRREIFDPTNAVYVADLVISTTGPPQPSRFHYFLKYQPKGIFSDAEMKTTYNCQSGIKQIIGEIALPIHPIGASDLLDLAYRMDAKDFQPIKTSVLPEKQTIDLDQPDALEFSIKNNQGYPLEIKRIVIDTSKSRCPKCWKEPAYVLPSQLILESGDAPTKFSVRLVPDLGPSLKQTMKRLKYGQDHDSLDLVIQYAPVDGGRERSQSVTMPIRFTPPIAVMIVFCLIGMLAGLLLRFALEGKACLTKENLTIAVVSVAIAQLVLLFGVSQSDRPLVFFGLNIDPAQLLPSFLLAFTLSCGPGIVAIMKAASGRFLELFTGTSNVQPQNEALARPIKADEPLDKSSAQTTTEGRE
jgi:hypothetical protein